MWRCTICNSPDVEALDWVDLNSGEHLGDQLDEYYCRSCGTKVEIFFDNENEKPMGDSTSEE